ncbi:MAG: hypothetical protein J7641_07340 [Cyanobacteria bacterium SID2]|nr:hypothetical protein [Cyanobacteria bacterium SID2]MBP0005519.1 hypothetical protein [Cyanobacteria bacterium SBC]
MKMTIERHFFRGRRRTVFSVLLALLTVLVVALPRIPATAQITQATIVEILDSDEVFVEEDKASIDQIAEFGQNIHTEDARAGLVFIDDLAVGRLGEDSSAIVGQCVEVQNGQLIASGPVNGCLSGFFVDVRGTIFIIDADDDKGNFKVLEGNIKVRNPERGQDIEVGQLQQLGRLDRDEPEIRRIDFEDLVKILAGVLFRGFEVKLPNEEKLLAICNEERFRIIEDAGEGGPVVAARLPQCPTELGVRVEPVIDLPF